MDVTNTYSWCHAPFGGVSEKIAGESSPATQPSPIRPCASSRPDAILQELDDPTVEVRGSPLAAPHLVLVETSNILRRSGLVGDLSDEEASLAHADLLELPPV